MLIIVREDTVMRKASTPEERLALINSYGGDTTLTTHKVVDLQDSLKLEADVHI